MANKLENLLRFEDFEKSWNPLKQKATKRTEVGLDVLNENIYMKVMDKTSSGYEENVKKFVKSIMNSINENQIKDISMTAKTATFTIRGRKYRVNKDEGIITLWRSKATEYREKKSDEAGRVREEKKRLKTRSEVEVDVEIPKNQAVNIYNGVKSRYEEDED